MQIRHTNLHFWRQKQAGGEVQRFVAGFLLEVYHNIFALMFFSASN